MNDIFIKHFYNNSMAWWDFTDQKFLILFIVTVCAILAIIFFVVSFAVASKQDHEFINKIKGQSNAKRLYIINVKRNKVQVIRISNLKARRVIDLHDFYASFADYSIESIKKWIFTICTDIKSADQYMQADIHTRHKNSDFFSLLKLLKYEREKGLVYVECHLLKYMSVGNQPVKKVRGTIAGVVKRSKMASLINEGVGSEGYTFAIRFYYVHQAALQSEDIERFILMSLKNEVYPYLTNSRNARQIVESNSNEIFLFDLRMTSSEASMSLAQSIVHDLNRCLSVNGFTGTINFSIGIVENKLFYRSFDTIIEQGRNACIKAQQDGNQIVVAKYSQTGNIDVSKFSQDVENLLKPDSVRYLYRPVVYTQRSGVSIFGYMSYVRAYDSPFASIQEMSKYASRVGKGKELFSTFAKNIIPKFASQNGDSNVRLFYSASLFDVEYILSILPQINRFKDVKLVMEFHEQEIKDNSANSEVIKSALTKVKDLGVELAIMLEDKDLLLDPEVYAYFDYFIAGAAMLGEIKKNNRIRLSIHTLIENLLQYRKPIIATDLEGWQAVELIIKAGINYLSSETISASYDMLLPVDSKKMDKIHTLDSKY